MGLKETLLDIVAKEATGKILPMDGAKPKLGKKAKAAALLGTIATVATIASQFLGG